MSARAGASWDVRVFPKREAHEQWRSRDGKYQYRAKPGDIQGHNGNPGHVHVEKLNPKTGEALENWHLQW